MPVHVNNFFAYLLFPRNAPANASAPLRNTRKANRIHCDGLAESLIYFYSRIFPTIFRVMSQNFDGRKKFPYAAHFSFFVPCLLSFFTFLLLQYIFPSRTLSTRLLYTILSFLFLSLFPLYYLVILLRSFPSKSSSVSLVTALC